MFIRYAIFPLKVTFYCILNQKNKLHQQRSQHAVLWISENVFKEATIWGCSTWVQNEKSRYIRRGKLQRDDYVVRMLRISRIFVVISWAKWREIINQNHSKPLWCQGWFSQLFSFSWHCNPSFRLMASLSLRNQHPGVVNTTGHGPYTQ